MGTKLLDDFQNMRTIEDCFTFSGKARNQLSKTKRGRDVEAGQGFVKNNQAWIVQESGDQQHLLTHPFRVRRQCDVALGMKREQLQKRIDLFQSLLTWNFAQGSDHVEVFAS